MALNSSGYLNSRGSSSIAFAAASRGEVVRGGLDGEALRDILVQDASRRSSAPEVKYRAIRQLKLLAYDDAKVLMSRKSLRSAGIDADAPHSGRGSPKEVPSPWTPLPGQNLQRWKNVS